MVSSSIAQMIGVTIFQFAVSIVDPAVLAQPSPPTDTTVEQGATTPVSAPAPAENSAPTGSGAILPMGTAGALQRGATQGLPSQ
jgi:hypothetical protein